MAAERYLPSEWEAVHHVAEKGTWERVALGTTLAECQGAAKAVEADADALFFFPRPVPSGHEALESFLETARRANPGRIHRVLEAELPQMGLQQTCGSSLGDCFCVIEIGGERWCTCWYRLAPNRVVELRCYRCNGIDP